MTLHAECVGCRGSPHSGQLTLDRGTICVKQGDPTTHVFAIIDGFLRECRRDAKGRVLSALIAGPGQILGLAALSPGRATYGATIDVLARARVCIIPVARAHAWLASNAGAALDLAILAATDLEKLRQDLAQRSSFAEDRVLALLTEIIRASMPTPDTWVTLPATRAQLAEVLGMALETLSRAMRSLVARGVLEQRGQEIRLPAVSGDPGPVDAARERVVEGLAELAGGGDDGGEVEAGG